MGNGRRTYAFFAAVFLLLTAVGLRWAGRMLTYIEYTAVNEENRGFVSLCAPGDTLKQEFVMPYDILQGVSFQIGTFNRDNNSDWSVRIIDPENGEELCRKDFGASLIADGGYHYIQLDEKLLLEKGKNYALLIVGERVSKGSSLVFYHSNTPAAEGAALIHNGTGINGELCLRIYGGDQHLWWTFFVLLLALLIAMMGLRAVWLKRNGRALWQDRLLLAGVLVMLCFLLRVSFCVNATPFGDEYDNFFGGMVIANGGVLYRDYYVQHTPIMYYISALFALLGAGSVEQFRLSWYLLVSLLWGGLFLRHEGFLGRRRFFLLAAALPVAIYPLMDSYGYRILSDGFQGLCVIVVLLEFVRYCRDGRLSWDRAAVVSLGIWGAVGAAFVSVYGMVWVVAAVLIRELGAVTGGQRKVKELVQRLAPTALCMLIPPLLTALYFYANGALAEAWDQIYVFNREVYPLYNGYGGSLLQPLVMSLQHLAGVFINNSQAIVQGTANLAAVLKLLLTGLVLAELGLAARRGAWLEAVTVFCTVGCSACRGGGFHALPFWYAVIMAAAVYWDELEEVLPRRTMPVLAALALLFSCPYLNAVSLNLYYRQPCISDMDALVICSTEEGDEIFQDFWVTSTFYYAYKDRYPANPVVHIHPWYMDRYEQVNIDCLLEEKPPLVIYNEQMVFWGYSYYAQAFLRELKDNYVRLTEDPAAGWPYFIWYPKVTAD